MNPDLARLQPYPFEKIRTLLEGISPPDIPAVSLAIGEPKHPTPDFIHQAIIANITSLANYPQTRGMVALREAIAGWLIRRFRLPQDSVDAEQHVIPVNGTREALFSFAQAVVGRKPGAAIAMPNPFYQIYRGQPCWQEQSLFFCHVRRITVLSLILLLFRQMYGNVASCFIFAVPVIPRVLSCLWMVSDGRWSWRKNTTSLLLPMNVTLSCILRKHSRLRDCYRLLLKWEILRGNAVQYFIVFPNVRMHRVCVPVLSRGMQMCCGNFCYSGLITVVLCHHPFSLAVLQPGMMNRMCRRTGVCIGRNLPL